MTQVELQLDRPQLPYSETLGPITAGGSPAHYRRRQTNTPYTKKAPILILMLIVNLMQSLKYVFSLAMVMRNLAIGFGMNKTGKSSEVEM